MKMIVTLHDALHGFRAGSSTGTATLEANLVLKFMRIAHKLLYHVLIDVRKVYDSLGKGWRMDILWGYGMGQSTSHLIVHHWDNLIFALKMKRFLGTPFGTGRGVMQG